MYRYIGIYIGVYICIYMGFPGGSVLKNPPVNTGDVGLIPGSGRSLREGNGNPLQYSCLGNPIDRGAWRATVHAKSSRSETDELLFSIKISKMLHITLELLNITA